METRDLDTSGFATAWSADNPPYVILKWSVRHFQLSSRVLESPCFDVCRTSRWNLLLEPRVEDGEDVFVVVRLRRSPRCEPSSARHLLKGEVSVHGPRNELIFDQIFEEVYDPALRDGLEFRIASLCFPKYGAEEAECLVRCEMVVSHEMDGEDAHLERLSADMGRLYEEGALADAALRPSGGGGGDIRVHGAVLRARSALFAGGERVVRVPEEAPYAAALLPFVYCGSPDRMFAAVPLEMFGVLAAAARRWGLDELVNVLTPLKMHCRTDVQSEEIQYAWDIKNLGGCDRTVQSAEFFVREGSGARWRLRLEKGERPGAEDTYGLYLVRASSDSTTRAADVEFRVLNCRTKASIAKRLGRLQLGRPEFGAPAFFARSFFRAAAAARDDPVQVTCTLKILLDTQSWIQYKGTSSDVRDRDPYSLKYLRILSTQLGRMLEEGADSDLDLACPDSRGLRAHRAVLWARCPLFREAPPAPGAPWHLPCDAGTLGEALAYVYTGAVPRLGPANGLRLYALSGRLGLGLLRDACRSHLAGHLTVDDVLEVLVAAREHEDAELERAAEAFVRAPRNARRILGTPRWAQFCRRHVELALPIYHHLAWAYCARF